jgi:uncharacterized protein
MLRAPMTGRAHQVFEKLAELQHRRAGTIVAVAVVVAALAVPLVLRLGLDSSFTALLPEDKPSVRDLEELEDRIGGLQTLTVAIQSDDLKAMQTFARDLVPRLETLDPEVIRSVDWNIGTFDQLVEEHRHLYANLDQLEEARDSLAERLDFERAKANPFFVRLDDEEPPDVESVIEGLRSRAKERSSRLERFPDGFYVHEEGDLLVLFVRADLSSGDAMGVAGLVDAIEGQVRALDPPTYAPDLTVEYAGSAIIVREEHEALVREMATAVLLTVSLVLIAILAFFRRLRSIVLLGGAMVTPVLVTFAMAEVIVDYLNTSTIFLGSIVIGNGVNPNIIWLARYFEERRHGRGGADAIARSHHGTWVATLTASLAAAIAYASLVITDFRGFRDFGIIGGMGMVLCWVGALVILPALAALLERLRPLRFSQADRERRPLYGRLFAKVVHARPRSIVAASAVLGAVVLGFGAYAVAIQWDPMEYDFRNLKSVREGSTRAKAINDRVGSIVGSTAQGNAIVVVAPDPQQATDLGAELERRRDEEGAPWARVDGVHKLLPSDQEAKIPLLAELRELLLDIRRYVDDERQAEIDEHLPPETVTPLTVDDLPQDVVRPFTERDGTVGRILLVENVEGRSIWDGRYLLEWADTLREVRLDDGTRPPLAGRAPVFADIIDVIVTDGPKAVLASFLATLLLVVVSFRRLRERLLTMMALLLGILWMAGLMALVGMRLNFLNFVAFPVTFGNGVDYGVNVMRRYSLEDAAGNLAAVRAAIEETGGAVVLCSLTTIIGYTSLYTSANLALNSFGLAMSISEVTCLVAAVLTMPALLLLLERRTKPGAPTRTPEPPVAGSA